MGRNFTWIARVNGSVIADGTVAGTDKHTADQVERDAASAVALRAGVDQRTVTVTVEEKPSLRQQIAEARAARKGK